jgi:hypothetical protein
VVLPKPTENNDKSNTDETLTEISSGTIPPVNELETREDGYHEKLKPDQMIIIASQYSTYHCFLSVLVIPHHC